MRYYELSITQIGQTKPQFFISTKLPNGDNNPSALNIDLDILVAPYNVPLGSQSIIVSGVDIKDMSQAQQYTDGILTLKGGFQKGLPLSNPNQAGVIVVGSVFQSYGNWQGTDMSLGFQVLPSPYSFNNPGNFTFRCNKGDDLRVSIEQTLNNTFKDYNININIPNPIIATRNLFAYYHSLEQFASDIVNISNDLTSNQYSVLITIQKGAIQVFQIKSEENKNLSTDTANQVIQLSLTDFVGQPTWIKPNTIQIKVQMRADIVVGSFVKMPINAINAPGFVMTAPASLPSQQKYQSIFKGTFIVNKLRHVGNFRNLDESAWVTMLDCTYYGP